jgi:hypothetical protein
LQRQQFRQVPASWRREILNAAPASTWREWLWPSPVAWGAVAAAWALIALLQLATVQPHGNGNGKHLSSEAFKQRQILMTQILEARS